MSYKSEKFQQVKDLIKQVDKNADFSVNFDTNRMQVYTRSKGVMFDILNALESINILPIIDTSTEITRFNIEL